MTKRNYAYVTPKCEPVVSTPVLCLPEGEDDWMNEDGWWVCHEAVERFWQDFGYKKSAKINFYCNKPHCHAVKLHFHVDEVFNELKWSVQKTEDHNGKPLWDTTLEELLWITCDTGDGCFLWVDVEIVE